MHKRVKDTLEVFGLLEEEIAKIAIKSRGEIKKPFSLHMGHKELMDTLGTPSITGETTRAPNIVPRPGIPRRNMTTEEFIRSVTQAIRLGG